MKPYRPQDCEPGMTMGVPNPFTVGTRKVVWWEGAWRIVCATCDGGGSYPYRYRTEALKQAIAQSSRPCQCKGCGAR